MLNDGAAIVLFHVLINELIPGHSQSGTYTIHSTCNCIDYDGIDKTKKCNFFSIVEVTWSLGDIIYMCILYMYTYLLNIQTLTRVPKRLSLTSDVVVYLYSNHFNRRFLL